ncbi:hypothetical protein SVAN01_00880 [Stagonosporopsis vannaccii]|nr:hypothetical protein SVAN01_00880 [Stagonosporopsis vannaccii]
MQCSGTTHYRIWGPHITESDFGISPTNLIPDQSFQGLESWIDICTDPTTTPTSEHSPTPFAWASKLECESPPNETAPNELQVTGLQTLDLLTFPQHAIHLFPSEPNGTWSTQASYAFKNPGNCTSNSRKAFEQHLYELNLPELLRRLKQVAQDGDQDVNNWLNQTFADHDLVEMHGRIQRLVPAISMPNMRHIDIAIDTAVGIALSLQNRRSESQLLKAHADDRHIFAQVVGYRAERALIEQGICNEWQLLDEQHEHMLHAMQSFLIHTFKHTQHSLDVPLYRAKPRWIADRKKKVWGLQLDVGRVGVEVGPATDRSLVELGFIQTGFDLPESCGCLTVMEFDRQVQTVDDEWQLLESLQ